ncbi:MAG: cob(I)yrinic acid a,c-diamide adenosyltransferase [Bacteroidia bacterium]|nr:cob(I)yrinic acid a,c-diamide adenosyltransferase [Bacteroidia bacterium]
MKIYTKKGDKGETSLIGGTRVPKHHIRIEAYGTVDELNSFIGLIRDQNVPNMPSDLIADIQDRLFTIGSQLASDPNKSKMKLPDIGNDDILALEKGIDEMNELLPELKAFILPGGHSSVSYCHIARCVCRRAERICTQLNESEPIDETIIIYLNRLSDYLFVLARFVGNSLKVKEISWKPKL